MHQSAHIHIKGQVQGVGFRPFVCRLAQELQIAGWVSNTNDGVHIEITAEKSDTENFYQQIIQKAPANAIISSHSFTIIDTKSFPGFSIRESNNSSKPDLLLTPDIAICEECKKEINDPADNRYGYAFSTCLHCGPRYSIVTSLPYDREHTTMADLHMCESCSEEYNDIANRRHYSQTNSCPQCAIQLHLYQSKENKIDIAEKEILKFLATKIKAGKILAIKGMGGYLLICDAANEKAVLTLRERKHRPAKPFALMYPSLDAIAADVHLHQFERDALQSKVAPIVLCQKKPVSGNVICSELIAPGLDKIGVMLPSTGLLSLLADKLGTPVIATSGNISGAPIIYKDEEALEHLFEVADYIVTYDREIVAPQDDSVMQFSEIGQKIILRRSRGLAPNYFPHPFANTNETILATGGELKSAFALLNKNNLYISQYLGDQGTLESQESYANTLLHMAQLLKTSPRKILVDKHPAYAVSAFGHSLALQKNKLPVIEVQHHKAHFAAVLAENNLLHIDEPVLGFIWDGTGYGDDQKIWGGEVFVTHQSEMSRLAHLKYFPQLVGDKMSREPRLSALSLLKDFPAQQLLIQKYFSKTEWKYYQKVLQQDNNIGTSSMGRFLDGLACMLGIRMYNAYEGEAAMQLEALARNYRKDIVLPYQLPLVNGVWDWTVFLQEFLVDLQQGKDSAFIARTIFYSLANAIGIAADQFNRNKLAFSGGVFQNALLVDCVIEQLAVKKQLYFHQQLSPNDECIGFGQLACYQMALQASGKYSISALSKIPFSLLN